MRKRLPRGKLAALLMLGWWIYPTFGGDALYGQVVSVKSAEVLALDYGRGQYYVKVAGIEVPGELAGKAEEFVRKQSLGKGANVRIEQWTTDGQIVARIFIEEPSTGKIFDLGLELVRAGLALRQKDYDYKYGELSAAEADAQKAGRGVWERLLEH